MYKIILISYKNGLISNSRELCRCNDIYDFRILFAFFQKNYNKEDRSQIVVCTF